MDFKLEAKVNELYELKAQLQGFNRQYVTEENGVKVFKEEALYKGLMKEVGVTEGTKRIANKIAKKIGVELEGIEEQRAKIRDDKYENQPELTPEEIDADKKKREAMLLDDKASLTLEELIDFNMVKSLSLSMDYSFIYEKLFTNY